MSTESFMKCDFEKAVCQFLDGEVSKQDVDEAFRWLAIRLIDKFGLERIFTDRDSAIKEIVGICHEKLPRYDRQKGKALSFCSTCGMSWLRQDAGYKKRFEERYGRRETTGTTLDAGA
jgi:hypothetical protein